MSRSIAVNVVAAVGFACLLVGSESILAQAPAKTGAKKAATKAAAAAEPATPEQAAKVLDLRTFPRIAGGKIGSFNTLGMLMYDAKAAPTAAFEFQRKELTKLGFKELPGGYSSDTTASGHFTKEGFVVAVSASPSIGDPDKAGWSSITLVNSGNVALDKLPVPPGAKPFHPTPQEASYTTAARPAETAAACRKLLLAAGWEPYGQEHAQPDSSMQHFKKNGIQLLSWISTTPVDGGKTLIRYSTELLSADLPCPSDAADPRYDDSQKTLRMDEPAAKTDAIIAFYSERLPKMGWKATTEKPIKDDARRTQFLVFRNAQKDLLSLDLTQFTDIVRVELRHQTLAEVEEGERLAKAAAEKERVAEEQRNKKIKVTVPLPAKADNLDKQEPNLFEFTLGSGSGPATLTAFREHFTKLGWTEVEGAEFEKVTGEINFKKDAAELSIRYFDIGGADFTVSASKNVVFEIASGKGAASEEPADDKPAADKPSADAPKKAKQKGKQKGEPVIPGLPPGVELPDDVKDLLKEALDQVEGAKPAPKKKP